MKKLKFFSVSIALLLMACAQGRTQDISSSRLNWNSIGTFLPTIADSVSENTRLITYSGDSIQWIASDNTLKYSFTIVEANGIWGNVSVPGTVIYEIENKGQYGTITLERTGGIVARIVLNTDKDPLVYVLNINSINTF